MKCGAAALASLTLLLLADTAPAQPRGPRRGGAQASRYGWLFSLREGKAQARASGKPLMVEIRCEP